MTGSDTARAMEADNLPTVLVVDDEPVNVMVLEGMLRKNGFSSLRALGGPEGRELARTARPDLILLDIMMPEETGFETCQKLKRDPLTADIPVIFISAVDDVDNKVRGLTMGAVDYIAKPFELPEVLARVRLHIRLRLAHEAAVREQRVRLEALRDAQRAILVKPEELPEAGFAALYRPRQEAGGDFYDVTRLGENIFGFFVADIAGHDVASSFLTAALKALGRQYSGPLYSPVETLRTINDVLRDLLREGQFLTACYAQINRSRGCLTVVGAAHPPAVLVRRTGEIETLETSGDVLGVFGSVVLESRETRVRPGDRFYLYTDGLIDGAKAGSASGGLDEAMGRLAAACAEAATLPLAQGLELVAERMSPPERAAGGEQVDDVLLLGVEV